MRGRIIMVIAAVSLIAVGAAGAVVVNRVILVRSGDQITVNKNLRCFVGTPNDIACGGASNRRISADITSSGEIVILAEPTPHGVAPLLFIDRAICNSKTGGCSLVVRNK